MSLEAEEGKGRNADGYTSSVDVVHVSEGGPSPVEGGAMLGREREVNDSSSQSLLEVNKHSSVKRSSVNRQHILMVID